MCYFITGIFSGNVSVGDINTIGKDYGLKFGYCENDFVQNQLKPGEHYISKMSKYCDCGTPLGMFKRHDNNQTGEAQKTEMAKLKQKGWSDAKIRRLLNDRNKRAEQEANKFEQGKLSASYEVQKWVDFIVRLFDSTSVKTFGILLHWYNGGVDTERIKLKGRAMIDKTKLSTLTLLEMEEDTLLIIT